MTAAVLLTTRMLGSAREEPTFAGTYGSNSLQSTDDKDINEHMQQASKPTNKILHYGSKHVIQNTGWTTRLTKELPNLKRLCPNKGQSGVTDHANLSLASIEKQMNVKQNSSVVEPTTSNNLMIQLVNSNASSMLVSISNPGPSIVTTTDYQKKAARADLAGGISVTTVLSENVNKQCNTNNIVSLPKELDSTNAVYFVPVSRPGSISFSGIGVANVLPVNKPSAFAGQQHSFPFVNRPYIAVPSSGLRLMRPPTRLPPPKTIFGNRVCAPPVVLPSSSVNSKSAPALLVSHTFGPTSKTVKTLAVFPSSDGCPDIRVLNTQVRIDGGVVTAVNELVAEPDIPTVPVMSTVNMLSAIANSDGASRGDFLPVYLADCNGARFGYYETPDGNRIRIAHDTSGQRHSPIWLIPPKIGPFVDSDVTIQVKSNSNKKGIKLPTEAEVSGVTTVFTYEPLLVSEQTLVPVSGSKIIQKPKEMPASFDDDEQYYAYRCYLCKFWSGEKSKLANHWLNVHMPDLQYCCPFCDRKFFTNVRTQMHVMHQHPEHTTPLVTFRRSVHYAQTLSFELVEQVGKKDIDVCEDQITLNPSGKTLFDVSYSCRKCSFTTRSAAELRQHQKSIHVQYKPLLCSHCTPNLNEKALSFASDNDLKKHIEANHPQEKLASESIKRMAVRIVEKDVVVRAEIPWNETWEEITVFGERKLQCRRCTHRAKDESSMWPHILQEHKWPTTAACPSCIATIMIGDVERHSGIVTCASCEAWVILGSSNTKNCSELILICNICSYKTQNRAIMMRHIKYNHTKYRPFGCPYCNYVAVLRDKVKLHITSVHPNKLIVIKESDEGGDQFQKYITSLFRRVVSVKLVNVSSRPNVAVKSPSSANENSLNSQDCSKAKSLCTSANLKRSESSGPNPSEVSQSSIVGEHFKCKICGYRCYDRSCMSRHIKYMHISSRPHSCPYCSYSNVEKTKVRLHVKSNHPGQQKSVRTDQRLLEEMSWCAKKFYVRVDHTGVELADNAMSSTNNSVERVSTRRSDASSEPLQTIPLSPNTFQASQLVDGMKFDESCFDNDVEFEIKPDWFRGGQAEVIFLDPIVSLDHNYFQPSAYRPPAPDALLQVKEEPFDAEYEQDLSNGEGDIKPNINEVNFSLGSVDESSRSAKLSFLSDSEDDFLSSELSDDSLSLPSDKGGDEDEQFFSDVAEDIAEKRGNLINEFSAYEPPIKKVCYGSNVVHGVTWKGIHIDETIMNDPKIRKGVSVELEDVVQIILAWQSGVVSPEESTNMA